VRLAGRGSATGDPRRRPRRRGRDPGARRAQGAHRPRPAAGAQAGGPLTLQVAGHSYAEIVAVLQMTRRTVERQLLRTGVRRGDRARSTVTARG